MSGVLDSSKEVEKIKEAEMHEAYDVRLITIEDYDEIYALWNATEQSRRALNPVDDSYEGIYRYLQLYHQNIDSLKKYLLKHDNPQNH